MNSSEFTGQLSRLRSRFGEKAYDKDFAHLLWQDVRDYSDGSFTKAVDAIISEHFRPIGKSAIVEITKQESIKGFKGQPNKSQITDSGCSNCDGFGLMYLVDSGHGKWLHSCEKCPNGDWQRKKTNLAPAETSGLRRGLVKR